MHNFEFLLPFSGSQKRGTYKITIQPRLVTWYNSCRHTAEKRKKKKANGANFLALILDQEWFYTFLHTSSWRLNHCTPVCFYTSDSSTASKPIYHCTYITCRNEIWICNQCCEEQTPPKILIQLWVLPVLTASLHRTLCDQLATPVTKSSKNLF